MLNRHWRSISQDVELYAHHLSRCPSYALTHNVITGPFRPKDLVRFRAAFSQEVRRNLFGAYLKPRRRLINLISVNANTSAALPRGEAFRFIFSPNGQTLLALSSSRIYILGVAEEEITVHRELKTLRRPLSAAILDDGSVLAVLSSRHQINIYGLTATGVKHLQVLVMDQPPRTISMAHEGTVLAVAYDSAIEVFSLAVNALSTDRRAVRCEPVDSLAFSGDGSMLVGTSTSAGDGNTVIITAPFYAENNPNSSPQELHSRLWTTQILFPETSSTCQFASLLPSHTEAEAQWLVAYDHVLRTLRAVRTDDTRTGVVYFIGPSPTGFAPPFRPNLEPTATNGGDLVAASFDNDRVYLYGVPSKIDYAPDMSHVMEKESSRMPLTSATVNRTSLAVYSPPASSIGSSSSSEEDDLVSKVDWRQSLFVKGRRVVEMKGISGIKWVQKAGIPDAAGSKRLAIVAPGGVDTLAENLGEEAMPVDGGRLYILDFDYSISDGRDEEITVEVGNREPELLPEQHGNLDVEVALERRRSVMHRNHHDVQGNRASLIRSATAGRFNSAHPASSLDEQVHHVFREGGNPNQLPLRDGGRGQQDQWSDQHPTNQNVSRGIRQMTSYLSTSPSGHVMFHRQNGQHEIPHESDADNWVPPPPPYHPTAETLLTPELRLSMLGTFSETHREIDNEGFSLPHRAQTIPEEGEYAIGHNITDLARSSSYPRPSYRARPHSESSISSISDLSSLQHRRNASVSQDSAAGIITPLSPSPHRIGLVSPQTTRTNSDTNISERSPSMHATITHPTSTEPVDVYQSQMEISPPATAGFLQASSSPQVTPTGLPTSATSTSRSSPKPVTLTGENLSRRLNYPTPPPPRDESSASMAQNNRDVSPPLPPEPHPYHDGSPQQPHEPSSDHDVSPAQPPEPLPYPDVSPPLPPDPLPYQPNPRPSTAPTSNPPSSQQAFDNGPSHPTSSQVASLQRCENPNQHWPLHRKSVPPLGHRLDPYRINPAPTGRRPPSSQTQDFASQGNMPNASTSSIPQFNRSSPDPHLNYPPRSSSKPSNPRTKRPLQPPHHRTEHGTSSSSSHRFNPFHSRTTHSTSYQDLASTHGGYGPHGSGPAPGTPPSVTPTRVKLTRLDTIQSIASNASERLGKVGNKGLRKGSEGTRTIRDKDGRCVVM